MERPSAQVCTTFELAHSLHGHPAPARPLPASKPTDVTSSEDRSGTDPSSGCINSALLQHVNHFPFQTRRQAVPPPKNSSIGHPAVQAIVFSSHPRSAGHSAAAKDVNVLSRQSGPQLAAAIAMHAMCRRCVETTSSDWRANVPLQQHGHRSIQNRSCVIVLYR
jgi:hypothetical protein